MTHIGLAVARFGVENPAAMEEVPPRADPRADSTPISVRPAGPDDAPAVAAIYAEAVASRRSTMDTVPPTGQQIEAQRMALTSREALLVAIRSSAVVGFGWLRQYSVRPGYRFACETSVYVRLETSGTGTGAALQTELIARARDEGFRYVVAKILSVNQRSVDFHRKFGFEMVGVQRGIGDLDGVRHDVTILGLELGP